jgi:hypothetical protein
MSRATLVYILMVLVGVAGTVVILKRGHVLHAPPDLSGDWHILGAESTANDSAGLGRTMHVEQSGRFVRLRFDRPLTIDVKLLSHAPTADGPTTRRAVQMQFKGNEWTLATLGVGAGGPLACTLSGREYHTFTVTRAATDAGTLAHESPAPQKIRPSREATADADAP